jgi:hypothetical protein
MFLLGGINPLTLINPLLLMLAASFVLEALVLYLMKWDKPMKCFGESLLLNIATILFGLLVFLIVAQTRILDEQENAEQLLMGGMLLLVVLFEALLLKFLKPARSYTSLILLSFVLNIISGLIFYFFFDNFQRIALSL